MESLGFPPRPRMAKNAPAARAGASKLPLLISIALAQPPGLAVGTSLPGLPLFGQGMTKRDREEANVSAGQRRIGNPAGVTQ